MVTAITLGNFFSTGGKNILGGVGGSGLNTQALIEGLVAAKSTPAFLLQQKITKSQAVNSALIEFNQLLGTFQSISDSIRNPPGVGNASSNAFAYTSATVNSSSGVPASNYLSVSSAAGATAPANYSISYITSLAAAAKQTTNTFSVTDANTTGLVVASGAVAGQFNAGTVVVNGYQITLDENDTLNSIAQKFNNLQSATGIAATVLKVSDGQFKLIFTAIQSGLDNGFDLGDAGTVDDPDGVFDQITFNTTQDAADAEFIFDGVTVSRSSNVITDLIDGLTFTLNQVTPDDPMDPPANPTVLNISINPDTTTARNSILAFVNSYNDLRTFAAEQLKTNNDGTFASDAVLATNQLFRSTIDTITSQVASIVNGLPNGDPNNLSDIGITFNSLPASGTTPEVSNILTVDDSVLTSALASDFTAVRDLFQFTLNSDNTNLAVFSRNNALGTTAFTLNINPFATQVTQTISIADADTIVAFDSPGEGQLGTGVITVNGQTITIDNTDTLNTIEAKFNAVAGDSGLTALVAGSGGEFTITFTAVRQTGKNNLFNLSSTALDPSGVFGNLTLTSTGVYQATYDNGSGDVVIDLDGQLTSGGAASLLTGQAGTVLQGLKLIYGSAAAAEINTTVTQGLGDTLYNTVYSVTDPVSGTLAVEFDGIEAAETSLSEQIDRINDQVELFREQLLLKFALLEQAISKVNNLLSALDAQDQARANA